MIFNWAAQSVTDDPLKLDTDEDGLSDGEEVLLELNLLLYDTYHDGVCDGDRKIQQISNVIVESYDDIISGLTVEMDTTGYLKDNLLVKNMFDIDTFTSNVIGLIGDPFEFDILSEFTEARITFVINQAKLEDIKLDDLLFLWYDEENKNFEKMVWMSI